MLHKISGVPGVDRWLRSSILHPAHLSHWRSVAGWRLLPGLHMLSMLTRLSKLIRRLSVLASLSMLSRLSVLSVLPILATHLRHKLGLHSRRILHLLLLRMHLLPIIWRHEVIWWEIGLFHALIAISFLHIKITFSFFRSHIDRNRRPPNKNFPHLRILHISSQG